VASIVAMGSKSLSPQCYGSGLRPCLPCRVLIMMTRTGSSVEMTWGPQLLPGTSSADAPAGVGNGGEGIDILERVTIRQDGTEASHLHSFASRGGRAD
jgi:hypothetical protein